MDDQFGSYTKVFMSDWREAEPYVFVLAILMLMNLLSGLLCWYLLGNTKGGCLCRKDIVKKAGMIIAIATVAAIDPFITDMFATKVVSWGFITAEFLNLAETLGKIGLPMYGLEGLLDRLKATNKAVDDSASSQSSLPGDASSTKETK